MLLRMTENDHDRSIVWRNKAAPLERKSGSHRHLCLTLLRDENTAAACGATQHVAIGSAPGPMRTTIQYSRGSAGYHPLANSPRLFRQQEVHYPLLSSPSSPVGVVERERRESQLHSSSSDLDLLHQAVFSVPHFAARCPFRV